MVFSAQTATTCNGLPVLHGLHLGLPVKGVQNAALVIGQGQGDPVDPGVQPLADLFQQLVQRPPRFWRRWRRYPPRGGGSPPRRMSDLLNTSIRGVVWAPSWVMRPSTTSDLLPPLGVGGIDDVEDQVRVRQLLQGGLEGLHQVVGQFSAMKPTVSEISHRAGVRESPRCRAVVSSVSNSRLLAGIPASVRALSRVDLPALV